MLDVYVCDDFPILCEFTAKEMSARIQENEGELKMNCVSTDPSDILIARKKSKNVGFYVLDIDLGVDRVDGFDLAEAIHKIDPHGFFVFVSSEIGLASEMQTKGLNVLDYIEKGNHERVGERLRTCVSKALKRVKAIEEARKENKIFEWTTPDLQITEPYDWILYFEQKKENLICMYTENDVILFAGKLSDIFQQVDQRFYQCNRFVLINLDNVAGFHVKSRSLNMKNHYSCIQIPFFSKFRLIKALKERNQADLLIHKL